MIAFAKIIDIIPIYLIYTLAFFLPLIFTPFTTEFYETAKLIFLAAIVLLLLFFWALKVFSENKITLLKTPLDLLLMLFLLVAFLSTIFSPTPYVALFGLLPKVSGSLISLAAIILLYFMAASNVKNMRETRTISEILIFSGIILSLISILSYFKIYLPWSGAAFQNFSLAGSASAAAAFLTIILPLALSLSFLDRNLKNAAFTTIFGTVSSLLFILTIILTGTTGIWIGTTFGIFLTVYFLRPAREQFFLLGTILAVSLIFAIMAYTPTLKDKTPIGNFSASFQKDMQLPFIFSWKISAGAFRDSPILGTGPATYLYNFTQYKPIEINQSDLWDKKVNSAHNQYLQTLAELGGAGVLLLIIITAVFVITAVKYRDKEGLAVSGITFFIVTALSPLTVLTQAAGFLIMALFLSNLREKHSQVKLMETRLGTEFGIHPLLPTIIFIPVLALIFASGYFVGKLALGEYYHRQALNFAISNSAKESYNKLIQAERINPQSDLYRVELAQTSLALANGIASLKAPTEASPGGSLTNDDKTTIQQLLQQAIGEGRNATALSSRSAGNWEILAQIYRQISGVAPNATAFSLDAYGRAIRQDPLNPLLRVSTGSIYYAAKNYDMAIRFFDDAVSLKPDFPNALYNLSIALQDKGNTEESIKVAEKLVSTLQDKPESENYSKASELLSKLKERQILEPSQQESSALDNSGVSNLSLPEPEKVATPPAIQR